MPIRLVIALWVGWVGYLQFCVPGLDSAFTVYYGYVYADAVGLQLCRSPTRLRIYCGFQFCRSCHLYLPVTVLLCHARLRLLRSVLDYRPAFARLLLRFYGSLRRRFSYGSYLPVTVTVGLRGWLHGYLHAFYITHVVAAVGYVPRSRCSARSARFVLPGWLV